MSIHSLNVSLPRLPASHKRCKVAWFGDAGGSETIETPRPTSIPVNGGIRFHPDHSMDETFLNDSTDHMKSR